MKDVKHRKTIFGGYLKSIFESAKKNGMNDLFNSF